MIRVSTKGRYATRIMVYLACCAEGVPARKQEIAGSEKVSADYAEQILMRLKTAGLVRSRRGPKGGFVLARDASEITVADVLEATEGPCRLVPCEEENCDRMSVCVMRKVWQEADRALNDVFSRKSILELAAEAHTASAPGPRSWSI